jgi:hypothetical protein
MSVGIRHIVDVQVTTLQWLLYGRLYGVQV